MAHPSSQSAAVQSAAQRVVSARTDRDHVGAEKFDALVEQCSATLDPEACSACEAIAADSQPLQRVESNDTAMSSRLNWLRAGVLGANDGIVSTAGIVTGVAGATIDSTTLLISGIAGVVAGGLSMAAGEYVSVSTQRDAERAALARQQTLVEQEPVAAERRLAGLIMNDGVSRVLAQRVAAELSGKNPLAAHAKYELGIDPDELTNPWHAAGASMLSFVLGALIPLLVIVLTPRSIAMGTTVSAVTLALAITGSVSAKLANAPILPATIRNIVWGNVAMLVTYGVGTLVGISI